MLEQRMASASNSASKNTGSRGPLGRCCRCCVNNRPVGAQTHPSHTYAQMFPRNASKKIQHKKLFYSPNYPKKNRINKQSLHKRVAKLWEKYSLYASRVLIGAVSHVTCYVIFCCTILNYSRAPLLIVALYCLKHRLDRIPLHNFLSVVFRIHSVST